LFASLVLLMAAAKKPIKTGTGSGHITNLKQSILETFDIYGSSTSKVMEHVPIRSRFLYTSMEWAANLIRSLWLKLLEVL